MNNHFTYAMHALFAAYGMPEHICTLYAAG